MRKKRSDDVENLVCVICGMNINHNNYDLNSKGLLRSNSEEEILYCPFCGAKVEYISKDKDIYNIDKNNLNEETIKIIDNAMKLEVFNSDFYKKAAVLSESEEVKKTFEALSKIELMHALIHKRLGGFNELPKLADINYEKHKGDKNLMDMAEKREIHAVEFYKKYAEKVNNEIVTKTFIALSEVEKDHIEIAHNY